MGASVPPLIQLPFLRPDPIHELGPDIQGQYGQMAKLLLARQEMQQQQQQHMQQLAVMKGHLAMEQEKFDAETKQRNEVKKQREDLSNRISAAFNPQAMQTPGGIAGAIGQTAGPMMGAGMGPEAGQLLGKVPALQQQQQLTATQAALGQVYQELSGKDLRDSRVQATAISHLAAIDPDAAKSFAESVKALNGRFTFAADGAGQWWIGDTQRGTMTKGDLGTPKGGAGGAVTSQEARMAAQVGAQAFADVLSLRKSELAAERPDPLIASTVAAIIQGAKLGGGMIGALAGAAEPFAQSQMTPAQHMVQRKRAQIMESYMAVISGKRAGGSPTLLNLVGNQFFPMAGQTDPSVINDAVSKMGQVQKMLGDFAQGKQIDMTILPGYNDYLRESLNLNQGQPAPGGAGTQTPGAQPFTGAPNIADFRQGVPQP